MHTRLHVAALINFLSNPSVFLYHVCTRLLPGNCAAGETVLNPQYRLTCPHTLSPANLSPALIPTDLSTDDY